MSPGSFKPFDTMRNKETEVARRIGREESASSVNKRGTVVGVTVRLISIQPNNEKLLL